MRVILLLPFVMILFFCQNPTGELERVSPIQKSTTQQLFPLVIGNSWTLTSENGRTHGTITISVVGDTIWNGAQYSILHETYGDTTQPYLYFARTDSLRRIVLIEGSVRRYMLDPSIEPNQNYENGIYNITVTHPPVVITKAGQLSDCIDFYIDAPQIADEETGFVFSPGIGIVRIYGSWGRDFRLVSNIIRQ